MTPDFRHPRYWPTWIAVGLLRALALLPYPVGLWVGRLLGRAIYLLLPGRRRTAQVNIRLCFPELSPTEQKRLAHRSVLSFGMGIAETAYCFWRPMESFRSRVDIEGLEHLEEALKQGRGAILLGAHMTTLDLAGALFSLYQDCDLVYRTQNNPLINQVLLEHRSRFVRHMIERNNIRQVVRQLKQGRVVWLAADQDAGRTQNAFAPFFGVTASTHTSISRLATVSRAPVVPILAYRVEESGRYRIVLSPALTPFPTDDPVADATLMNRTLEELIRPYPEQYYWIHRRFKTQPDQPKAALYRR